MSIPADDSRCYCIRCGGVEFRMISGSTSGSTQRGSSHGATAVPNTSADAAVAVLCGPPVESYDHGSVR